MDAILRYGAELGNGVQCDVNRENVTKVQMEDELRECVEVGVQVQNRVNAIMEPRLRSMIDMLTYSPGGYVPFV